METLCSDSTISRRARRCGFRRAARRTSWRSCACGRWTSRRCGGHPARCTRQSSPCSQRLTRESQCNCAPTRRSTSSYPRLTRRTRRGPRPPGRAPDPPPRRARQAPARARGSPSASPHTTSTSPACASLASCIALSCVSSATRLSSEAFIHNQIHS